MNGAGGAARVSQLERGRARVAEGHGPWHGAFVATTSQLVRSFKRTQWLAQTRTLHAPATQGSQWKGKTVKRGRVRCTGPTYVDNTDS